MNIIETEFERYSSLVDNSKLKNKVFLVTGAKGYLASTTIRFLLFLNKKFDLSLFIYATTRNASNLPTYIKEDDPISYINYEEFDKIIYMQPIDYIVHTAANTDRHYMIEHPIESYELIVNGTKRVLDFAKLQGVKSVLYLSSVEAYGSPKTDKLVEESDYFALDPTDIRNSYPLGKKVAEYFCNTYYKEYNLPVNIVRPSSVQGLFQPYTEDRIYNQILRCIIEHKDFVMKTRGETAKTLIYTLDAVVGMLAILLSGKYGETYNLTDNRTFYMMKDIVQLLFDHFETGLKVIFDLEDNTKTGYIAPLSYNLSTAKLESLGWKPQTDLFKIYEIDVVRFSDEL